MLCPLLNPCNADAGTPLHDAVRLRDLSEVKRLLELDDTDVAAVDSNGRTALMVAAMEGLKQSAQT